VTHSTSPAALVCRLIVERNGIRGKTLVFLHCTHHVSRPVNPSHYTHPYTLLPALERPIGPIFLLHPTITPLHRLLLRTIPSNILPSSIPNTSAREDLDGCRASSLLLLYALLTPQERASLGTILSHKAKVQYNTVLYRHKAVQY
jgi:hypothetical protein